MKQADSIDGDFDNEEEYHYRLYYHRDDQEFNCY